MNPKKAAPGWVRDAGRRATVWYGERTAGRRPLPDFLVVGGQRCGTTSLFRALMAHPDIAGHMHKGVNYFDVNYHRGEEWYRATSRALGGGPDRGCSTPAATTCSTRSPPSASSHDLPGDQDRRHGARPGRAGVVGVQARAGARVRVGDARFAGARRSRGCRDSRARWSGCVADPTYQSFNHRHHAYRRRGEYARLLEPFIEGLGRDHVHIIESESFFAEPAPDYARITEFLEVDRRHPGSFERYNARPSAGMDPDVRAGLRAHYEGPDEDLGRLLGHAPRWRGAVAL